MRPGDIMKPEEVPHLVRTYRMITPTVAGRKLCGRNTAKARRILDKLTDAGKLYRHEFRDRRAKEPIVYYTVTQRPLRPKVLHGAFAVLWFCCVSKPRKRLLTAHQVRKLTTDIRRDGELRLVGLPRCYITPASADAQRKVSLLRVDHPPRPRRINLNDAVADLDAFVCRPAFEIWRQFALADRFVLTYLVPGAENAAELGIWLQRRPPVSRMGKLAVPIPVHVDVARSIIPP